MKVSWGLSQDSVGALFVQERKNLPRPMHDAPEIGVDLALEFIRGHFFKRADETISGVVHHHINGTEDFHGPCSHIVRRGNVQLHRANLITVDFGQIGRHVSNGVRQIYGRMRQYRRARAVVVLCKDDDAGLREQSGSKTDASRNLLNRPEHFVG